MVLNKELSSEEQSRKEYMDFVDKVRQNLSKCFDNPNLLSRTTEGNYKSGSRST